MPESDFAILITMMLDKFQQEQNAEMYALCKAAEYQHTTLKKIAGSKLISTMPAIASEAYTTANDIASKVLPNIPGVQSGTNQTVQA